MRKYQKDLRIAGKDKLANNYVLLRLTDDTAALPPMVPGQFVQIRVEHSSGTLLRRPISINMVDRERNELWLLIHEVGNGTRALGRLEQGDSVNVLFPLGNGYTLPAEGARRTKVLLVGGGVGTAPMLYLGQELAARGHEPVFLLGGRSKTDLLELEAFERTGRVFVTTEDGTLGERGYVTQHSILEKEQFDAIKTCGPKPMMVSVARFAKAHGVACEVSLENLMACGLGACLCCVEKNKEGHNVRVCTEGPVFSIEQLQWQI